MNLQGIFSIRGEAGNWLYYCRETVRNNAEAERMTRELARRLDRVACVTVQDWDAHGDKVHYFSTDGSK